MNKSAISDLNNKIIACKEEVNKQYSHAEKLNVFIASLFRKTDFYSM